MDKPPSRDAETRRGALARRFRAVPGLLARAPWWLTVVVGLVLVGAGIYLLARPLTTLGVLGWYIGVSCLLSGVGDLIAPSQDPDSHEGRYLPVAGAWMWILGGLAILASVGRSPDLLGPVVVAILFVSGVCALAGLIRHPSADSMLLAVFGVSEIAFGTVALLWPDATLVVIGVLFAGRTIVFGMTLLWRASRSRQRRSPGGPDTRRRTRWEAGIRWVAAAIALVLAGVVLVMSHSYREGVPVADSFYDAPADKVGEPGRLLRWEPYDGNLPADMTAYRLLYATTNDDGAAVLASAALAVPEDSPAPAPLITWAHGTVGVARGCAPTIGPDAITPNGMPAMDALARNNWAIVATDYPGMGTEGPFPYLIRQGQGRAVLDAIRAAHHVPDVRLADEAVIWGHSQGGHAALAAGELAATYTPDLDIVGTAALSPAANPMALAEIVLANPQAAGASLAVSFVVDSYTRYYDDLDFDRVVAPTARTIVREAVARCTSQTGTLVTILTGLAIARDQPIVHPDALDGPFGERLHQNIPTGPWSIPLFIAHGEADEVIPFSLTEEYVTGLCQADVNIEFHGYPGGTHMSILEAGSRLTSDLEEWTRERFDGHQPTGNCT